MKEDFLREFKALLEKYDARINADDQELAISVDNEIVFRTDRQEINHTDL